jgi:hypothetical protein
VWRGAALALARNGRRQQLIDWAGERKADDHLDVLWVLKHNHPKEWAEAELAFWLACARRNPGSVAWVLRLCNGPIPTAFREPIRSYLKREIAAPTVKSSSQAAYELFAAVYVLDAWNNPDDTPLLLEYLKHPLRDTATRIAGERRTELHVYRLRDHVRALLEKRGTKVPPGVVYEEEVGPAKE